MLLLIIIFLLILILLCMFKPVRALVGIIFVAGFVYYMWSIQPDRSPPSGPCTATTSRTGTTWNCK